MAPNDNIPTIVIAVCIFTLFFPDIFYALSGNIISIQAVPIFLCVSHKYIDNKKAKYIVYKQPHIKEYGLDKKEEIVWS